uniref:Myosin-17-like n=1 Tax=Rhizophora mucronata TaxID=61149 RepID=A0A2P2MP15_RHIMU
MGTQFPQCNSFILFHHVSVIQMRQSLKWINCYQNVACVCL